jgi:predicted MFS family arabinose efflux permease
MGDPDFTAREECGMLVPRTLARSTRRARARAILIDCKPVVAAAHRRCDMPRDSSRLRSVDSPRPVSSSSVAAPHLTRELPLLLTLAAVQFTHVVDFMIMMPLGPQFMRLFAIGPQQFSLLVSAYTFAAAASGFVAALWIDRFDRRRALLALYGGFIVATALCGIAPGLSAAASRARRAPACSAACWAASLSRSSPTSSRTDRRASATAIVAAAFSLSAVAGLPLSLWIAAHFSWRAPFLTLAVFSAVVALVAIRLIPPLAAHVPRAVRRGPLAPARAIFTVRNHWRSVRLHDVARAARVRRDSRSSPRTTSPTSGSPRRTSRSSTFAGGATTLVTAQGDRTARRTATARSGCSRSLPLISIVPILVIHPHASAAARSGRSRCRCCSSCSCPGRFGPRPALVTGSVEPRLRGSFMTFNASIQQLASGVASLAAGLIVGRAPDGELTNFGAVGWLSAACTVVCLWLVRRIRIVDAGSGKAPP